MGDGLNNANDIITFRREVVRNGSRHFLQIEEVEVGLRMVVLARVLK
jgi:hypothetical protein